MDPIWGVSSAGRAPALQAGGHRFDPGTLHQKSFGASGEKRLTEASTGEGNGSCWSFIESLAKAKDSIAPCKLNIDEIMMQL